MKNKKSIDAIKIDICIHCGSLLKGESFNHTKKCVIADCPNCGQKYNIYGVTLKQ